METVIEHEEAQSYFAITTDERKWKNRLAKLAKEHPGDCVCWAVNEEDGSVFYHVPESWVAIRPPRKSTMTDEQKAIAADRLRKYRAEQSET